MFNVSNAPTISRVDAIRNEALLSVRYTFGFHEGYDPMYEDLVLCFSVVYDELPLEEICDILDAYNKNSYEAGCEVFWNAILQAFYRYVSDDSADEDIVEFLREHDVINHWRVNTYLRNRRNKKSDKGNEE